MCPSRRRRRDARPWRRLVSHRVWHGRATRPGVDDGAVLRRLAASTPEDSRFVWIPPPPGSHGAMRRSSGNSRTWPRSRSELGARPAPVGRPATRARRAGEGGHHLRHGRGSAARGGTESAAGLPRHAVMGAGKPGAGGRFAPDLRPVYELGQALAERFRGRVQAWEPWNEANIAVFGGHTVDQMCAWQKAAWLGFKAGDPSVIVAGMSPPRCPPQSTRTGSWRTDLALLRHVQHPHVRLVARLCGAVGAGARGRGRTSALDHGGGSGTRHLGTPRGLTWIRAWNG